MSTNSRKYNQNEVYNRYVTAVDGLRTLGWTVGPQGHIREGQVLYAVRMYGALGAVEALDSDLAFARANAARRAGFLASAASLKKAG